MPSETDGATEVLISLPLEGESQYHGTLRLRLAGWEPDGRPIVGVRPVPRSVKVRRKRRGFDKLPPGSVD